MKTFLAVVGALALVFILAIVALVVWLWWKVRRIARQVTGAMESLTADARTQSSVPPFRVTLNPVPAIVQAIRERWSTAIALHRQSEAGDLKIADRSE
jgi:hypothetical protein